MNDNRRDDPNQEDSADQDWTPWMDEDASDDELPSFSHDSDEDAGGASRDDDIDSGGATDLDDFADPPEEVRPPAQAPEPGTALPVPPVLPVTGQARGQTPSARHMEADWREDLSENHSDYEDGWEDDEFDAEEAVGHGIEPARFTDTWPIGLIAVTVLALVLLAAGGYGVMKQRAAMEQQIRELQAQLAVAAKPAGVSDAQATLETLQTENRQLSDTLATLRDKNQQLSDTLAGLEKQLTVQRTATARAAPATAASKPAPKPAASTQTTPAATTGPWFVNFSSYSERSAAQSWSTRLKPSAGTVTVSSAQRNGETLYRVRVINLASESSAQAVARQLEREHGLTKLWIGKE